MISLLLVRRSLMPTSTLTSKGQITLPKEVRAHLGVAEGDRVDFVIGTDGSVRLVPLSRPVRELYGLLKVAGQQRTSLEAIDDSIADFVAADDERIRRGR